MGPLSYFLLFIEIIRNNLDGAKMRSIEDGIGVWGDGLGSPYLTIGTCFTPCPLKGYNYEV